MKTIDELLRDIDVDKKLTLESAVAIDSFGYDIISRLHGRLSLEEKNRNISEDDIWNRIKNGEIDNKIVRKVLFKE